MKVSLLLDLVINKCQIQVLEMMQYDPNFPSGDLNSSQINGEMLNGEEHDGPEGSAENESINEEEETKTEDDESSETSPESSPNSSFNTTINTNANPLPVPSEPSNGSFKPQEVSQANTSFELSLPSTVTVLDCPSGGKVYLVGTAHFSEQSQNDVAIVSFYILCFKN